MGAQLQSLQLMAIGVSIFTRLCDCTLTVKSLGGIGHSPCSQYMGLAIGGDTIDILNYWFQQEQLNLCAQLHMLPASPAICGLTRAIEGHFHSNRERPPSTCHFQAHVQHPFKKELEPHSVRVKGKKSEKKYCSPSCLAPHPPRTSPNLTVLDRVTE